MVMLPKASSVLTIVLVSLFIAVTYFLYIFEQDVHPVAPLTTVKTVKNATGITVDPENVTEQHNVTVTTITKHIYKEDVSSVTQRNQSLRSSEVTTNASLSKPTTRNIPRIITSHEKFSRVFPVWNRSTAYSWCHRKEEANSGLVFVKVPKCASSNGMGVTLRIADTLGHRILNESCYARYRHGIASIGDRNYLTRNTQRSFMWSMIRHPSSRAISAYFFYMASRRAENATEERILNFAKDKKFQSFFVNYLKLKSFKTRNEEIQHLMQQYDFLAISERMEESMVVLSMLAQLPIADVIVMNSKTSGGYDDGRSRHGCVLLKEKWTTPKIKNYVYGDFLKNNSDYVLYKAINASLDRTIDAIGRQAVQAGIKTFQQLMKKNEEACRERAIFPCPLVLPNHKALSQKDCYFSDAGCGHTCTDEVLRTESLRAWNSFHAILA